MKNTPVNRLFLFLILFLISGYGIHWAIKRYAMSGGPPQKQQMVSMAERLTIADEKGDVKAASALLDESIALFRALNPTGTPSPQSRDCLLAAADLSDGIIAVIRGGHWQDRKQFETNVRDCR